MLVKYLVIILSLNILISKSATAQAATSLTVLKKFDYPYTSRFKGKHLIIDLFSMRCQACFSVLPKVNELQRQFKGRVHFLLLGNEDGRIGKVYEKFKKLLNLELDVYYDSVFFKKYAIKKVPLYIWIDKKGIIKAVTNLLSLTPENIEKFIDDQFNETFEENQPKTFAWNRPFLVGGNGGADSNFLFRSVLSKWEEKMASFALSRLTFVPGTSTFQALNVSMNDLYLFAYFDMNKWDMQDSLYGKAFPKIIMQEDTISSAEKEKYCYSFTMPKDKADINVLRRTLRNDLENYFGFAVSESVMKAPYWSIQIQPEQVKNVQTRGGPRVLRFNYAGISVRNCPIRDLIRNLEVVRTDEFQYIDDTKLNCNVDIEVAANMTDPEDVRRALSKAGFTVIKAEKEMRVVKLRKLLAQTSK